MKAALLPLAPRCAALFCAALLPSLFAQTAPTASTPPGDPNEKPLVLSPFVVNTSESEDGYLARATTAGTRTKTDLKDVGASIDVLTDEFLNDVGALNMNDALKYVANMSNYDGADNDLTNSSQWFAAPYNARGFRSDSSLIDFFPVPIISIDRYNTESLTFLKGSNAILFGIGSPGGSINSSYKRANLGRDNYSISYTTDSFDSHRGEFDANRVLIKNKLGVRIAAVNEERHTFKEPSLDRKKGFYGTATYRPFDKTTITVAADEGHRFRYLELNNVVLDSYTPWVLAGKPLIDWKARGVLTATTPEANDAVGVNGIDRISTNPVLIHVEGLGTQNWRHMGESVKLGTAPNRIAFTDVNNILTSPDGQQWRLDLTTNVFGNMNYHKTHHRSKSAFVQQNILEGLDVELAANTFDVQYSSDAAGWANRPELQADPNILLPDGTPNPNVGKPYLEADRHRDDTERREFTNLRATVSYEFNLDDRKIFRNVGFGRYKLLGLWEKQDLDVWVVTGEQINTTPSTAPVNGGPAFPALLDNAQNQIRRRYYFQPNQTVYQYDGPLVGRNVGAGIAPGWGITSNIRQSTQTTESLVGVVQGQWWEAKDGFYRLVGMYGVRDEDFTAKAKAFVKGANGLYAGDYRQIKAVTEQGTWNAPSTRTPQTKTYSIVARPHSMVSLFYNFSDIFSTADANFRDVYGAPLRPVFGDTQDYGVKLSLLKDRISVHFTKFETRQFDQNLQIGGNVRTWSNEIWTALATYHSPTGPMPDAAKASQFNAQVREVWRSYRDDSTTGHEITVAGRITDNWNVRVTAGKQTTMIDATNNDTDAWVTENWALWQTYASVTNPAQATGIRSTVGGTASEVRRQLDEERAVIGLRQSNQRQYNFRANTTYNFREGRLKGFTAGLGARWDSENVLGFARVGTVTPVTPLDISNPYWGPKLFNVDLNLGYSRRLFNDRVKWSVYLNVYNLLDDGGLTHRAAVDSGIDHNRLITERYMIAPRSFQLRNTFSF